MKTRREEKNHYVDVSEQKTHFKIHQSAFSLGGGVYG